jgi:hypothetical protein
MSTDISRFWNVPLTGQFGTIPDVEVSAGVLSGTPIPCKVAIVTALHGNSNSFIRVGVAGNTKAGYGTELAGGETVALAVNNLNAVGLYGAIGTDKVSCTYLW